MRNTIMFMLIFTVVFSCDTDDTVIIPACGVSNPANDLQWLRTEIEEREANPTEDTQYCYVTQGEFEGETVFAYWDCNPTINKISPVHNCEGQVLNTTENPITINDIENQRVIWRPDDFSCTIAF